MREPPGPSHQNAALAMGTMLGAGRLKAKHSMPLAAKISGKPAAWPKESAAEAALEVPLAVREVAGEGFGVGQVRVGLDDRAADGIPAAELHVFFDARE